MEIAVVFVLSVETLVAFATLGRAGRKVARAAVSRRPGRSS